jgi:hypothetical protein
MLPFHPLATAIQADREREIRDRSPLQVGLSSGPRHPRPETSEARPAPGSDPGPLRVNPPSRVALGEAR